MWEELGGLCILSSSVLTVLPGSEVKTMLTKLKGQLEDMRSRVHFLGLVQRYLQASDWGCLHPQDQAWAGSPTPRPTWASQP